MKKTSDFTKNVDSVELTKINFGDVQFNISLSLKCTMYIVFICNSHSFIVGQPIKTTYPG